MWLTSRSMSMPVTEASKHNLSRNRHCGSWVENSAAILAQAPYAIFLAWAMALLSAALLLGPPPLTSFLWSPTPSAQGWASHLPPATAPKHTRPTSSSPPLFPSNGIAAPGSPSTDTANTSHWWGFQPWPTPAWYAHVRGTLKEHQLTTCRLRPPRLPTA